MAVRSAPQIRRCVFLPDFLEDMEYWINTDRRMALRLLRIVRETLRNPFEGIGKPEPLKHLDPNTWSRRLSDADRIVYCVYDDRVGFLQGRYHY
jgi:toxin YoeB